jgi:glutathione S-transferase
MDSFPAGISVRLYNYPQSGNCYKVRLLLAQLGIPYERLTVDILNDRDRDHPLTRLNINGGRVPILRLGEDTFLFESNAIIFAVSRGTPLAAANSLAQAKELQWLFFEQNSHEPNIARLRLWTINGLLPTIPTDVIKHRRELGDFALSVMDRHLAENEFFLGDQYGIADISLYAYTHVADEADFDLGAYPSIQRWLGSVKSRQGHVTINE